MRLNSIYAQNLAGLLVPEIYSKLVDFEVPRDELNLWKCQVPISMIKIKIKSKVQSAKCKVQRPNRIIYQNFEENVIGPKAKAPISLIQRTLEWSTFFDLMYNRSNTFQTIATREKAVQFNKKFHHA